jgi:hypothetical protein
VFTGIYFSITSLRGIKMKFLSLVWKSTVLLFRRNRAAFVIFLAVQTVVSLGFVFFFTTTFTARENYMRSRENMRTVEVDLSEPAAGSSVAGLPDKLAKNPAVSLSNIQFTFILNSEKGKERPRQFIAYRNPDEYKGRIVGAGITQRQITEKSPVIVSGNMDRMMDPKSVWHQAGDTEELDGLKLKVIGTYQTTDNYGEIPYTVGLRHFALKSMKLQVPARRHGQPEGSAWAIRGKPDSWVPREGAGSPDAEGSGQHAFPVSGGAADRRQRACQPAVYF